MDINELLQLEHQGWASLCDGTGAAFYGRVMTDNALMVLAHGQALDREAVAASLSQAPPWARYAITDEKLVMIDQQSAALVYTAHASRDDGTPEFRALMSSVYTRHEGQWRLSLYQQTPIPPETA